MVGGAVLDVPLAARAPLALAYLLLQAGLVVTAGRRPDNAFGFRMFKESSTIRVELGREVESPSGHGTIVVPLGASGTWTAKDREAGAHRFSWRDRVRDPILSRVGTTVPAAYGVDAQMSRLAAALEDVAAHTPEDTETRRLVADVTTQRNGRDATTTRLYSKPR